MSARHRPEAQVQRAILAMCRLRGILAYHVPNEGQRSMIGHVGAKRDGMLRGAPDLQLIYKGRPGAFEVKRPGWKAPLPPRPGAAPTAAWNAWEERLRVHGYFRRAGCPVAVVQSLDDAEDALREWGWL